MLLLLIACPAAQLGIELPEGGVGAISQEDLQRDVFALSREAPSVVFERRMRQMNVDAVEVGEGRLCARRDGRGGGAAVVVAAAWPDTLGGRVGTAALVSLAKGWDGAKGPPVTTWLCAARPGTALPADPPLRVDEVVPTAATGDALTAESVDWRVVQRDVAGLFARLDTP